MPADTESRGSTDGKASDGKSVAEGTERSKEVVKKLVRDTYIKLRS